MARRLYRTRGGPLIKTYFAISDIHGFYYPMHRSLYKAGFRKTNPDHILIVCGDIFDRGPDSVKVYNFLKSLPRDRRILIRGNHEFLLRDLREVILSVSMRITLSGNIFSKNSSTFSVP